MSDATGSDRRPFFGLTADEAARTVVRLGGRPVHARALRRAVLRAIPATAPATTPGCTGADGAWSAVAPHGGARLPDGLVAALAAEGFVPLRSRVAHEQRADDRSTKLVVELADGRTVECVVMPAAKGTWSVCVSSQVGCPVGCPFCASGIGGLVRNLAAHEIIEQFAHARRVADVRRAVVMGIGEPLLNLDALLEALGTVVQELGFAETRLVISTVGYPDRVRRLAASGRRYGLALSLHAVTDELRDRLVPAMRGVPIQEVIDAARAWTEATGGRVQFEYVVLRDVNDDLAAVDRLAGLIGGFPSYVNFIAWNDVPGLPFARPDDARVAALVRRARDRGLVATRRRTLGSEATAACGQLRRGLPVST